MTVPGNIDALLLGGQRGYQIERSLRFNSADSAYLNRTPASDTSGNKKGTFSCWMKVSSNSGTNGGTFLGAADTYHYGQFYSETLYFGNDSYYVNTAAVFRDFSAWYHVVFVFDTTLATTNDRMIIYVNNVRQAVGSFNVQPSQNANFKFFNTAQQYEIGRRSSSNYFSGYLTEVHFIDGQALTPSNFGETDTITGVWKPKKYTGTYGTNGFYLKFADNSGTTSTTLGKDSSGNSNNWTPNNFSVTAGSGNDSMIDTPTPYADGGNGRGNYCTLNPLANGGTLANGNLDATSSTNKVIYSTFALDAGKYYWEVTLNGSNLQQIGIADLTKTNTTNSAPGDSGRNGYIYLTDGKTYNNGTLLSSYSSSTTNDVIGLAYDAPSNKLWIRKNNGSWFAGGDPAAGTTPTMTTSSSYSYTAVLGAGGGTDAVNASVNFGQRAFAYTPPSGFLALNTQNLPEPSIKKPSSYFDAKLYTGTGATLNVTGLGFSPDLVWTKNRSSINNNRLYDPLRGTTKELYSNATDAETTDANSLTAFNSDGFTLGSSSGPNNSGSSYVAWCWDAGSGTSTNNAGTITSTVSANASAGFSIITFTGNATAGATVGHGLGVAPKMVIYKARNNGNDWWTYHSGLTSAAYAIAINGTGAQNNTVNFFNSTAPSATVLTLGYWNNPTGFNLSTQNYVAYCFSEVAGFSKFGSYTGNGSTDGPFVFCGFRPRWVMIKRTDGAGSWFMIDTARATYNVVNPYLMANVSNSEATDLSWDILSNGFKLRSSYIDINASSGSFVFAAFSENPFKYSLAR